MVDGDWCIFILATVVSEWRILILVVQTTCCSLSEQKSSCCLLYFTSKFPLNLVGSKWLSDMIVFICRHYQVIW